jgi:TetR/AcrR family transcriptional regulator
VRLFAPELSNGFFQVVKPEIKPPQPKPDTQRAILIAAIRLFADLGFSGVTTRMIAREVGIGIATLYHHFPDKEALYLAAVQHAYSDKAREFSEMSVAHDPPLEKLRRMVFRFAHVAAADPYFTRLVKREQLEGDPRRIRILVDSTLGEQVGATYRVIEDLNTDYDPHLLLMSILGMILHQYEAASMSPLFDYFKPEHLDPDVVATHVFALLTKGISGNGSA